MEKAGIREVRILVDPVCPWTYRTARWLLEVRGLLAIEILWGLLSLEFINRGVPDHPMAQKFKANRLAMRVLHIAWERMGNRGLEEAYLSLARYIHEMGMPVEEPDTLVEALKARGLPPGWVDEAKEDESLDARLWDLYSQETSRGVFGVPTIFFGNSEVGYYGPVISKVPESQEALTLWRGIEKLVGLSFFYELKRPR